jgi:hypothetical protein
MTKLTENSWCARRVHSARQQNQEDANAAVSLACRHLAGVFRFHRVQE